ncbi:pectate lyase [Catenuloplanes nepalensis]|uniref:Pectate lyase n=1 Tax=Catenuloplanes nepalensis TaxID=587533 RepID=A0ABT9MWP0_9ACTN|nr:RICIN domain-containing protein [Catenuloplanes nepalensis]MDP9795426.1 pectate lyase [Catenuloplanes nepalensis]
MPRKRTLGVLAALAVAVPAAIVYAAGLSQAAAAPVAGGVYTLVPGASGKCVAAPSTSSGAPLVQVGCAAGDAAQQWKVVAAGTGHFLSNVATGLCIDVPSGATTSNLRLQQYACGSVQNNRVWSFTASSAASGRYRVTNAATSLCLSTRDGSTAGNNPIVQETCSDISRMQIAFNQVGGTVTPTPSGRVWSNTADGFAQGTTGGAGGSTVTVTNYADLLRYATATEPYVIKVAATVTVTPFGNEIPVKSNKTIIGVGRSGAIRNGGFFLGAGVSNVIIRNLTIGETDVASDDPDDKDFDYDGVQMDTAKNVWIDHNTIKNVNDGSIDSRKDTTNVTISWNHLPGHNKNIGIGWTENVTARITIHHNWIQNTNQRNPSADNLEYAHLYNNYLQNVTSYGNYSRGYTKMVLENSYFQSVKDPYYPDATAQLRQSGSICVSCTGKQQTSGSAFNPSSFYAYSLDPAAAVPSLLQQYTGPQANIGL